MALEGQLARNGERSRDNQRARRRPPLPGAPGAGAGDAPVPATPAPATPAPETGDGVKGTASERVKDNEVDVLDPVESSGQSAQERPHNR